MQCQSFVKLFRPLAVVNYLWAQPQKIIGWIFEQLYLKRKVAMHDFVLTPVYSWGVPVIYEKILRGHII